MAGGLYVYVVGAVVTGGVRNLLTCLAKHKSAASFVLQLLSEKTEGICLIMEPTVLLRTPRAYPGVQHSHHSNTLGPAHE